MIEPVRVRYYAVGEYGDETFRPHYHIALFGYPSCVRGRTDHRAKFCCGSCQTVKDAWQLGGVDLGELNKDTAQYISGYVTKKMTKGDDKRLNGRYPEFSRMSRRPGVGATAMEDVASSLMRHSDVALVGGDVPTALVHGRKAMPLGRYLRRCLRKELGFGNLAATPEGLKKSSFEMRFLLEEALLSPENTSKGIKQIALEMNKQKVLNMEARYKIHKGRKSL